ncbi:hypothetical protein [Bacteroides heparinolyticus]|uniref:hypothetical protein n=1 Tax=Prevotella heparinolytica TaxID=28113 RepID=UPI0035A037A6
MKTKRIVWMTTLLLLLGVAGCEKETGTSTDQRQIGDVVEVFELAYGQSKEITYGGKEKFTLSLQDIKDHVTVNCALADFKSREEYASVKIDAYLQINNEKKRIEVSSKPCGALPYAGKGDEVKDMTRLIEEINAAPANAKDRSYYSDRFRSLFGEGTPIKQGAFRIFIGKASLCKYASPEARVEDYKLVFILTSNSK